MSKVNKARVLCYLIGVINGIVIGVIIALGVN